MRIGALLIGTMFGLPVHAADAIPLQHGVYSSSACENAANAALLTYDGNTLNGAHSTDCTMQVKSAGKGMYRIAHSCPAHALATQGPTSRLELEQVVSVSSEKSFVLANDDGSGPRTFHFCSAL